MFLYPHKLNLWRYYKIKSEEMFSVFSQSGPIITQKFSNE